MAGSLFTFPRARIMSSGNAPVGGAKMYFYQAGTTVLVPIWYDASMTLPAPNPLVADSAGEFRPVFLDPGAGYNYRVVWQTSSGVQLGAEDNLPAASATSGGGGTQGPAGTPGLSVAELLIYRRSATPPGTPSGGSFNFSTQLLTPPTDWEIGIPTGNEPIYVSTTVAAINGASGTDDLLTWSAPVRFAQDGSSVDIVFRRSATQPATPAPSAGVPAGWYTDVGSVPASTDTLWSSVGTRDNASQNWVWQLPIQVEGDPGPAGTDAVLYYIKPTSGTAIKNGTGQLTVEARRVTGGNDVLLTSGTIQLYVGSTLVTAANGYVSGSNGYTGIFDSGDIGGSVTVTLKNGAGGAALDTITLVDVTDGSIGGTGYDAVYGYIEATQGLAWVRANDQTTWTPSSTTTKLNCTFVQAGADVARVAWTLTRSSAGILTGATATHDAGDLNSGRVTVTELNEGTQAMTVTFAYSNAGDASKVSETVITSLAGATGSAGSTGSTGAAGADGISVAELVIYQRAAAPPSTPTGGSYLFDTATLTPPSGWTSAIPSGYEPVYASRAVASVTGPTGTDSTLTWSTPVRALEDGASLDIIFRRSAAQPATPAPSSGVPAGWYSDVASVPVSTDLLWSSVGSRDNAAENWTWDVPIQVEGSQGDPGADGADAVLYYIKPMNGTVIKNGSGTLEVEAHKITGGTDALLAAGTIKLYVGSTEVTVANGYATGSDGYNGFFDSGDIGGAVTVTLKDGPSGDPLDTITLVDVADGTADTGSDAVYGYVEADGPLAWVRGSDGSTWTPAASTLDLDCTFVQGGADVARVAWRITRASDGTLTGASTTHTGGDLNGSRVTVTPLGSGSQVYTAKFSYSNAGDESVVSETVLTSLSGTSGGTGPTGPAALGLTLTKRVIPLATYQNGSVVSYATANGQATVYSGSSDVTATATLAVSTSSGVTGATINTATNTPVNGQPKGYYKIDTLTADVGTVTLQATYGGVTITEVVQFSRNYVGYEIVGSLPVSNLFIGRMVFLDTVGQQKLYRYTSGGWTAAVNGADITALSVTTDDMFAATVTTGKLRVTQLSVLSANAGTITAGILQSASGGARFDLNNARIIFNSAPGQTGGFVRVQGGGFGPAGEYLDWYGPKPAGQTTDSGIIGALTDNAAHYFLKTNGFVKSAGQRIRGEFEPKAWARFTTQTSQAILQDRFNISSMTNTGTGRYTVVFAEPLANDNYLVVSNASSSYTNPNTTVYIMAPSGLLTTGFNLTCTNAAGNARDAIYGGFFVFGSNVVSGSNVTSPSGGSGGGTIGWGNLPSNYTMP